MLRTVVPVGLRQRLMLLIAWTVLGSMALFLVNALQQRRAAVQTTSDEAALLSRLAAAQQERVIVVARLMLEDWARSQGSSVRPARLAERSPGGLSGLARVTPAGRIATSTDAREIGADVSSTEWFRRAAHRHRFVVSNVYEKRGDSLSTLRCALPVYADDGGLREVVVATFDIAQLCRAELPAHFDANTTFLLVDRRGVVVAPAGRPAASRDSSVTLAFAPEGRPWRQRLRGGDGISRIVAFTPLRDGSSQGLFVGVSVDPAELLARADRELAASVAMMALFGLVVAMVTWRGAKLIVLRRVEAMHAMTRKLRAGDLEARTGLPYGSGELSELSRALDEMAITLSQHNAERERADGRLRLSEARTRAVLEASIDGIFLVDKAGRIVEFNAAARRIAAGGAMPERPSRMRGMAIEALLAGPLPAPDGPQVLTRELPRADGSTLAVEIVVAPAGQLAAEGLVVASVRDISERVRWQQALEALSVTDELTGLRNRRGFLTSATERLRILARDGGDAIVLSLDLDGLKAINDTHGHAEGDHALRVLATALRRCFRTTDVIARLGGDEFVVLAAVNKAQGARRAIARFTRTLNERNAVGDLPFALDASVGWARWRPGSGDDLTTLLARADRSMYRRKRERRESRAADAAGPHAVPSPVTPLPRRPSRVA